MTVLLTHEELEVALRTGANLGRATKCRIGLGGSPGTMMPEAPGMSFHNSTFELWLATSDQDVAAYVKTGGHFERWPWSKQAIMCM